MNFRKVLKNFICLILLYTIFTANTSIFYIFANETNEPTTNQIDNKEDDKQNIENDSQTEVTSKDEQQIPQVEDPLGLTAKSAVLIDAKTGIVIYDKNKDIKSYPASTTKILTALLAIENTEPTDILNHSHNAVFNIGPGSSHIGMRENEQITMDQGLYGVLLASANEVCMAIAEKVSGSVENFVDLMNKRAKEIGAKNTHFANPHGFHDDNHYTTSYDMALIMKEAIKNQEFIKYISTPSYTIPPTNLVDEQRILNNSNKLILKTSPYYYQYCVGGKTGFTDQAGNTLVTYAKKGDIELIAVVMKDEGFKVYDDTKALFNYGFNAYDEKEIFDKEGYKNKANIVQKFKGKDIPLGEVYVVAENNLSLDLPKTVDVSKIERVANIPTAVEGPINVGDKVGTLDFLYENNKIASINLLSENKIDTIEESKLERQEKIKNISKLTIKILKYLLICIVIFIVVFFALAFIIRTIIKTRRKNKRKRRYGNNTLKPMAKNRNNTRRRRK